VSAAELRKAAETLRERATAASKAPWSPEPLYDLSVWSEANDDCQIVSVGTSGSHDDLRYIATMHPGVGLALADWLDTRAELHELTARLEVPNLDNCPGLALARLINGGAS
jgi:hypothetical protein